MKTLTSNILGVIPARFNSTRLMGKPLEIIGDKTMIEHVYLRANKVLENLVVATDDSRIYDKVKEFNGNVILTDVDHLNGTSRCLEAFEKWSKEINKSFNYIINIQGDEPLLHSDHLNKLIGCFEDKEANFATVALKIDSNNKMLKEKVCLVKDIHDYALYFSRNKIPFIRNHKEENIKNQQTFFQHIGIYGYSIEALKKFCSLPSSSLENAEKLEQLRWLENGGKIKVGITNFPSYPVDTLEDLVEIRKKIDENHNL
jgi:3-deoxy-manno-octulosonate cytidylyltransferase (CMP-KDO synthetase)